MEQNAPALYELAVPLVLGLFGTGSATAVGAGVADAWPLWKAMAQTGVGTIPLRRGQMIPVAGMR